MDTEKLIEKILSDLYVLNKEFSDHFKTPCRWDIDKFRNILSKHLSKDREKITGETSDGYHTFNELYEHRHALFIALVKCFPDRAYRANNNDNGENYHGWFVLGIHTPNGDVSYHLPDKYWTELDGYGIQTTLNAPQWDGHKSQDVIDRLHKRDIKDREKVEIKKSVEDITPYLKNQTIHRCGRCETKLYGYSYCPQCGAELMLNGIVLHI